jgi:hypothetical protein
VLDEFRHEFPPLDPEEDAQVRREYREATRRAETAAVALEDTLVIGTDLLNEHPLVKEALVARGPLRLPIGYIELADEQKPVAAVFAELEAYLAQRLNTGHGIQLVLVGRDVRGRSALAPVVP